MGLATPEYPPHPLPETWTRRSPFVLSETPTGYITHTAKYLKNHQIQLFYPFNETNLLLHFLIHLFNQHVLHSALHLHSPRRWRREGWPYPVR